jgi:DNA invertase Pin-like site-specific DNA recombinase
MPKVTTIPPRRKTGNTSAQQEVKKLRVAAYCRVSTDYEEQASSYQTQIEHYTEVIERNPEWVLAGIYADDGISATSTKRREQFNQMIQDCMGGKIDMVITKSISRFARNTVDCLNYIRELKSRNVAIYFEKENINTLDSRGEVLITIMASLAQQESESLSQNVRLGIQYRFQQGKVMVNANCFLGYDKDADGRLVINEQQAETVKRIFREYLEGASCQQIARLLENDGIPTGRGKARWHDSTIRKILENEKYMGDALLQKTYTKDFLSKKRLKNNGDIPQYHVEDLHEPIIPKDLFLKVQEEIARRGSLTDCRGRKRGFSSNHCFTGLVFCGACGALYRRIHWNNRGCKSIVWRCATRLDQKDACSARTVNEELLKKAFVAAVNQIITDSSTYIPILQDNIASVLRMSNPESEEAIQERINELQHMLVECASQEKDYEDIAQEIFRLRAQKEQVSMNDTTRSDYLKRIQEMQEFIASQPSTITEFDEKLVSHLLAKVTVSDTTITFEFKSGVSVQIEN